MGCRRMKMKRLSFAWLLPSLWLVLLIPSVDVKAQDKFSGLIFGDYYWVDNHHTSSIEGMNGFWFRRIYLTYDRKLPENMDVRVRFEANSPGNFTGTDRLNPFLKDVYIRYTGKEYQVLLGLQPTPTFSNIEDFHGYRYVEKTPADLYLIADSRDTGISIKGKTRDGKTGYWFMVGNDSGTRAETNRGKAFYVNVNHWVTPEVYLEVYGDFRDKQGPNDWTTFSGFLGYKNRGVDAGINYLHQTREASGPDLNLDGVSFYIGYQASKKVKPFFRVDVMNDPIPNANTISYIVLSPNAKPTLYIAGVEFKVTDNVRLTPNVEWVTYRDGSPNPSDDVIFRLTFYSFWN
jgi:hypothetical protein